jgi:glutamate N-acetyltransferase/amino-acid N-acetyltransferase
MKRIEGGICSIEGVRACGVKHGKYGLALIAASGTAAGVFTRNKIKAAPLSLTEMHLEGGLLDGIIANSGCANAYTGNRGIEDAAKMAEMLASFLGTKQSSIGVASTGVIGAYLDLDLIEEMFSEIKFKLANSPEASHNATKAIMTTDTALKEIAVEHEGIRVAGIVKGAGMIEPDMATMLAFLYTDAKVSRDEMLEALKVAVDDSFNMLVVDGDTSTNDMVLITSTGTKECSLDAFKESLGYVCIELAKMIARDGEGATKYIETEVVGALTAEDARKAARAVVRSDLVKTAIFGEDPNWGRIIAAVGRSGAEVVPENITLCLKSNGSVVTLVDQGRVMEGVLEVAEEIMRAKEIFILVDLGLGEEMARSFGCDLSYDYVEINSAYTS